MKSRLYETNIRLLKALPATQVPSTIPISRELRAAARAATRILDVGCGSGKKTAALRAHASAPILGIDVNGSAIELARRRFECDGLRFLTADVMKPLALRTKFDVINLSACLTLVVPEKSRQKMVKNLVKLLAPRGVMVISDFLQAWHLPQYRKRYEHGGLVTRERGSFAVADASSRETLYYAHHFSTPELLELLESAGLALLSFRRTRFATATGNRIAGFVLTAQSGH